MEDIQNCIDNFKEFINCFEKYINLLTTERDYYQQKYEELINQDVAIQLLQYQNLRKNFNKLVECVLGEDYYNMGMDVYTCDELTCEDIAKACKKGKKWNESE